MKNVLITGNRGYIGSVLVPMMLHQGYNVVGLDTNYYYNCVATSEILPPVQIQKDIRNISKEDLQNIDSIVHLAALSNDPLGQLNPDLTQSINYDSTIRLATLASECGISRFIFASTQSIYGISNGETELKESDHIQPITEYAKSKWLAEKELKKIASDKFTVVMLRPSTVYGPSPKLRCDILLNNLVGYAYTSNKIVIKSNDNPWRPVIHINDTCKAFISCLRAPKTLINNEVFNVGIEGGNYSVTELAKKIAAQSRIQSIQFTNEHKDSRSYSVCFKKILNQLDEYYKPEENVNDGIDEMFRFYRRIGLVDSDFEGLKYIRIKQLKHLNNKNKLDDKMHWLN